MLITSCFCIIIILSVVKLAIATGHVMPVFNDLHYSKFSIACLAWPVAMASLPLNCLYNVYMKILSQILFQLLF